MRKVKLKDFLKETFMNWDAPALTDPESKCEPKGTKRDLFYSSLVPSKNDLSPFDLKDIPYVHTRNKYQFLYEVISTYFIQKGLKENGATFTLEKSGYLKEVDGFEFERIIKMMGPYTLFSRNSSEFAYVAYDTNSFIIVDRGSKNKSGERHFSFYFCSMNKSCFKTFDEVTSSHLVYDESPQDIHVLMQTCSEVEIRSIDQSLIPLQRENYEPKIIQEFDYVVKQLGSENPNGKLLLLSGEPGTGKTYFTRGLINTIENCTVVVLPVSLLSKVDGPSLLPVLFSHKQDHEDKHLLFVIEDADSCLISRMSDNITSISSLLNLTDGLLGSALDIRILATTNADSLEVDKALLRPGRLLKHLEINSLSPSCANKVYKRLTGERNNVFNENVILAQIYAKANKVEIKPEPEKKLGF